MSAAGQATVAAAAASAVADARGIALGYEPPADRGGDGRLWLPVGGSHRVVADRARAARLREAVLDLMPEPGVRLVVLGAEVAGLTPAARTALRARIALLPAGGGLISHFNAWENIVLPLGFHHPERLHGIAERVLGLLAALGTEPRALLAKLPEEMTAYEKGAAACVRIVLEAPELVLAEDRSGSLEAVSARARPAADFAAAYLAACAGGTFIQLDNAPGF